MHIGFYSPNWPATRSANGIVTYVKHMEAELAAQGHAISIVSSGKIHFADGSVEPWPTRGGVINRIRSRVQGLIGRSSAALPWAGAAIADSFAIINRRQKLDIVEMEESFGWSGMVQDRLDAPVVTRLHGPHFLGQCDIESAEAAQASRVRMAAEGWAINRAGLLTAPSARLLAATLDAYGSQAKASLCIPNPVAQVADSESWSVDQCDRNLVLCVGRFDRRKGADIAIEAFGRIVEVRPQTRLVMVGPNGGVQIDGCLIPFEEYCARFVDASVRARISHLGTLDADEIVALRRQSMVTMVCSRFENFPYAIAEAMALGCPIVATDSFGNGEMIEDGRSGRLVPIEAAAAMADAVLDMLQSPAAAAAMGAAAQTRCRQLYAPAVVAKATMDFYTAGLG